MKDVSVGFLGCGDAFGSGGRFQTCILVDSGKSRFLLDCGASSLIAMKRFGVESSDIDAILISHLHGDHFGGLPFFILDSQLIARRTRPLTIAGPPGLKERVESAMEIMFPGSSQTQRKFELDFKELPEDDATELGNLMVTPKRVVHGSGAPAYAFRIEFAGRTIAYSGDTEWTESLIELAKGADLFVCEAYFYEKILKNHLNYRTLISRRKDLDCSRIILTHLGDDMLEHLDDLLLECAEDGMVVTL
ncbi:MAG: MBL fold metallo-hydrolase [Proteobacteria bacterium]|nr:MBL fold metallo-hydrolase [Pseudomonadota bacterium]